ncbi:hypothetical protein HN51_008202 [Arachis hypogaea]|uniref:Uncharacterized protein n=1 Tax=Arachis hypogaea TaxID=3818 RepID=A0A445D4D0_ARAHY|nr:Ribonuclease [Arachis hypogaea]RYR58083.1 hypothetical protein Ahy_A05g023766 [Arachis hypogaea]
MNSLFIVFHVILLASSVHLTNAASYEYFKLALVWPATFTRIHASGMTKPKIPNYFTIHGLWPTNFSSPWPQSCAEKPADYFKRSSIDTLQNGLNHYWPNLKSAETNMELWIEEWEKHGTCSLQKFNQSEYFRQAISITEFLDILVVFKNVGIIPHRTKTYSLIDIVNAIKETKTRQVEPELVCFQDRSDVLLREIRVCLDANLAEYISCPINRSKGVILCKTKSNAIKIPV